MSISAPDISKSQGEENRTVFVVVVVVVFVIMLMFVHIFSGSHTILPDIMLVLIAQVGTRI